MSTRRTNSAILLCVAAVALATIAWKLVAPPQSRSAAVQPEAGAPVARADAPVLLQSVERAPGEARAGAESGAPAAPPVAPAPETAPDRRTFLLYGFVRPAAGDEALASDTVVVLTDQLGAARRTPVATDGAYSFADVAPGPCWLRAGSSADTEARASLTITRDLQLDLQLAKAPQVRVRALDPAGAPLKQGPFELFAVATLAPPGPWFDEARGSHNNPFGVGSFQNDQIGGVAADGTIGLLVLRVQPPVHVSLVHNQFVVATQRVEAGQDEVTFVLERDTGGLRKTSLRFRLVDAQSGAVIEKAFVSLNNSSSTRTGKPPTDGQHELTNLSPGTYVIHARAQGFGDPARRVRLEPGVDQDLGDIALEPAVTISGRIVDPDGNGVATDVRYDACDADGKPLPWLGAIYVTKSDPDGAFRIPGQTRGFHALSVSKEPWGPWRRTIDARAGSVEGVEARLERAVSLVVGASSNAWPQVRFSVFDAGGDRVLDDRLWQPEPRAIRLAPGSYEVEVHATADAVPRRIPITAVRDPVFLTLP